MFFIVVCDQTYFALIVFWSFPNLQVFVHKTQFYKMQVFYFFQLYGKQSLKLVNLPFPLNAIQERLDVGQNWNFLLV